MNYIPTCKDCGTLATKVHDNLFECDTCGWNIRTETSFRAKCICGKEIEVPQNPDNPTKFLLDCPHCGYKTTLTANVEDVT